MPTTTAGFVYLGSMHPPVLSISPDGADHTLLHKIMDPAWTVIEAFNLSAGLAALRENPIAIVLCEGDLQPWKDVYAETLDLPHPPRLIVTSRLADETLWAEVLNLGAYDVLAKPFDVQEVQRVSAMAWQHWERENWTAPRSIPGQSGGRVRKLAKGPGATDGQYQRLESLSA
jgi:DNA-binding NtrC family response regulator